MLVKSAQYVVRPSRLRYFAVCGLHDHRSIHACGFSRKGRDPARIQDLDEVAAHLHTVLVADPHRPRALYADAAAGSTKDFADLGLWGAVLFERNAGLGVRGRNLPASTFFRSQPQR